MCLLLFNNAWVLMKFVIMLHLYINFVCEASAEIP